MPAHPTPQTRLLIRPSVADDIPAFTAIYAHAVQNATGSFELEAPDATEMARRRDDVLAKQLPWLTAHVEATRREMGEDFWPYGLPRNDQALATFLRYSHEQGLSKRLLVPSELFAPETLTEFRI